MFEDIFIKNLPTIDLHGFDRDSARVTTNDFIQEAFLMGYDKIVIIHGIGTGVVKKSVYDALRKNKLVNSYHVYEMNVGCTIIEISKNEN